MVKLIEIDDFVGGQNCFRFCFGDWVRHVD